jgi:hypothetical protein
MVLGPHFSPTICCIGGLDRACFPPAGGLGPALPCSKQGYAATGRPFALRAQDEPPQWASACPEPFDFAQDKPRRRVAGLASTAFSAGSRRKAVRNVG